ncbi:hypothetical protein BgiBS90_038153 [Biomphalaria glabrata]|nr:hypothetical protein BgiBS90_038153 [Biomphalaria glabrata]
MLSTEHRHRDETSQPLARREARLAESSGNARRVLTVSGWLTEARLTQSALYAVFADPRPGVCMAYSLRTLSPSNLIGTLRS